MRATTRQRGPCHLIGSKTAELPAPTAPDGGECAPTCRTITQQVNSDWCHRCRQRMRRYAEGIDEPFCACGRRISECDGSRVGCGKRPTPTQKGGGDGR